MNTPEKRDIDHVVRIESRAKGDKTVDILLGRSIVFAALSQPLIEFSDGTKLYERILRSAFDGCDLSDVRCHVDHRRVLGRTPDTLQLILSDDGLDFECELADTTVGRDTRIEVERRDLRGCSFMWPWDAWEREYEETDSGDIIRTVTKIKRLIDVGPVYNPAYLQTSVSTNKRDYLPETAKDKPTAFNRVPLLRQMLNLKSK